MITIEVTPPPEIIIEISPVGFGVQGVPGPPGPVGPGGPSVPDPVALAADPAFTTRYAPISQLYLPGVTGNYVSTPDDASLDIVGDLDLSALVTLTDWTPAVINTLIAKDGQGTNRSYELKVNTNGTLTLVWSPDGTFAALATKNSTIPVPVADGAEIWVRATLDVDNGAAGNSVKFYTAPAAGSAVPTVWTQLGATVTTAGVTSIFAGTAVLAVGAYSDGITQLMTGRIRRAIVKNGLAGTIVADYRADVPAGPRYRDSTGKVWTINGSAWAWMAS